jgi:hypothetical protein
MWKWTFRFSAGPKRCFSVMARCAGGAPEADLVGFQG